MPKGIIYIKIKSTSCLCEEEGTFYFVRLMNFVGGGGRVQKAKNFLDVTYGSPKYVSAPLNSLKRILEFIFRIPHFTTNGCSVTCEMGNKI